MLLRLTLFVVCLATLSIKSAEPSCPVIFEKSDGQSLTLGEIKLGKSQSTCTCTPRVHEVHAKCTSENKGLLRMLERKLQFCDGESWVGLLENGNTRESPGIDCQDILNRGQSRGDGLYWLDPDGGNHSNAFQAYCDMTSYDGGWTMCYTTDEYAKPKTEVTYNPQFPFGTDGYRTNCNNIPFTEIIFIDHQTGEKAYFKRATNQQIKASDNYGKKADTYGLWNGFGTMNGDYSYQLLICDTLFYSGFFVSGYTNCYKVCNSWCGDRKSPYFRTASTSSSYKGVAFNINGHNPVSTRLMSVGLR